MTGPRLYLSATLVLVALLGQLFWSTLHDARVPTEVLTEVFFTSDLMYAPTLYQDLVIDGYSWSTFQFSAATFWFPDVLIYFVWRTVLGQVAPAIMATVATLFVAHVFAAIHWGRTLLGPGRAWAVVPLGILAAGVYLGLSAVNLYHWQHEREFYLPGYHSGVTLVAYLALAAVVRGVRSASSWGLTPITGTTILGFTVLAVASDRLFGLWFIGPVIVALLLTRLLNRDALFQLTWRKVLWISATVLLGTGLGWLILKVLQPPTGDPMSNYWIGPQWDVFVRLFKEFVKLIRYELANGNWLILLWLGWSVWCVGLITRAVGHRLFGVGRVVDGAWLFWAVFCLSASIANVLVFLLSKTAESYLAVLEWGQLSRYFAGPISMAFFSVVYGLARIAQAGSASAQQAALTLPLALALGLVVVGFTRTPQPEPNRDLIDHYPDYVAELDRVCHTHQVREGLGSYLVAKQATMLSRQSIVIRQVEVTTMAPHGFTAFAWLSNAEHYWKPAVGHSKPPRFEFLVVHPTDPRMLHTQDMLAIYGEPAHRELVGPFEILIYNRPSDRLKQFPAEDARVRMRQAQEAGEMTITFPGSSFWGRPPFHHSPDRQDRIAREGQTPVGILAFGPYLDHLTPGRYNVAFCTSTENVPTGNGTVDVVLLDAVSQTNSILVAETVPVGSRQITSFVITIPPHIRQPRLEFRTTYHGVGTLTLHTVAVTRE